MRYADKINKGIDNGSIDTDDLKTDFNETLYKKGFSFEDVTEYTDEHFENLLTFKKNETKFLKWYNQQK